MNMHKVWVSEGIYFGGYILYNLGYIHSTGRYYLNGEEIEDDKEYVLEF